MGVKVRVPNKSKPRSIGDSVVALKDMMSRLNGRLIDRVTELTVLPLAVLAEEHVMLDGPPGVAKSMLADLVFREFEGARLFRKRLMKGTQPEELFGPMNISRLRNDSVVEFNVTNMMPDANFLFLDEVYRASDMVLESMLGILNEREFINGAEVCRCPLITAIGTTNFVTDTDELKAYVDRWLVTVKLSNLSNSASRQRMYSSYLNMLFGNTEVTVARPLSLSELRDLIRYRGGIEIPDTVLKLYDELLQLIERTSAQSNLKVEISDRRRCQILKLLQANALMDLRDSVNVDDLAVVQYGLTPVNDPHYASMFMSAFQNVAVTAKKEQEDRKSLAKISDFLDKAYDLFDESLSDAHLSALYNRLYGGQGAFIDRRNSWPSTELQRCADSLESKMLLLKNSVAEELRRRNPSRTDLKETNTDAAPNDDVVAPNDDVVAPNNT